MQVLDFFAAPFWRSGVTTVNDTHRLISHTQIKVEPYGTIEFLDCIAYCSPWVEIPFPPDTVIPPGVIASEKELYERLKEMEFKDRPEVLYIAGANQCFGFQSKVNAFGGTSISDFDLKFYTFLDILRSFIKIKK